MSGLIGDTGKSFLDVWTIPHLAFWTFVGSVIWPFMKDSTTNARLAALAICLVLAYAWEAFEKVAEEKWPHLWLNPESWLNSMVSDPLTTVIGVWGMMFLLDRFAR
jgi:hypothetical protein